jgi:hypothetical protein
MELRNRFHGIDSASLWSLAGLYGNSIPTRFLAPMAYSKIAALDTFGAGSTIFVTSGRKDFVFILCKIANFSLLILSLEHRHPAPPRPVGLKVINLL